MIIHDQIIINFQTKKQKKYSFYFPYDYLLSHKENKAKLAAITNFIFANLPKLPKFLRKNLKHKPEHQTKFANYDVTLAHGLVESDFARLGEPHLILDLDEQKQKLTFNDQLQFEVGSNAFFFSKQELSTACAANLKQHNFTIVEHPFRDLWEQLKTQPWANALACFAQFRTLVNHGLVWEQVFFTEKITTKFNKQEQTLAEIFSNETGINLLLPENFTNEYQNKLIFNSLIFPHSLAQVQVNLLQLQKMQATHNQANQICHYEQKLLFLQQDYQGYLTQKELLLAEIPAAVLKNADLAVVTSYEVENQAVINKIENQLQALKQKDQTLAKQQPQALAYLQQLKTASAKTALAKDKADEITIASAMVRSKQQTTSKSKAEVAVNAKSKIVNVAKSQKLSESDRSLFVKISDQTAVWLPKSYFCQQQNNEHGKQQAFVADLPINGNFHLYQKAKDEQYCAINSVVTSTELAQLMEQQFQKETLLTMKQMWTKVPQTSNKQQQAKSNYQQQLFVLD